MEKVRTFIAVSIPAEVKRQLAEIEKKLAVSGADVKWANESNFHITMKFIGPMDSNRIDEVAEAIDSAIQGIEPFEVSLAGVGAFPRVSKPNIVWVGISTGGDELKTIAEKIDTALEPLGFEKEDRPFSPHITVGRTKSLNNVAQLQHAIDDLKDVQAGIFQVGEVIVMKSDLHPSGPVYSELAVCRLQDNSWGFEPIE